MQTQTIFSKTNTPEYKKQTAKRSTEYTIKENLKNYPQFSKELKSWKSKQTGYTKPSFSGVFNGTVVTRPDGSQTWKSDQLMMYIDQMILSEDVGQRNCLAYATRQKKLLAMAKNFDPLLFDPVSIDEIAVAGHGVVRLIRDGGGRATVAKALGISEIPVCVRIVGTKEESGKLFDRQHKYTAKINEYERFNRALNEPTNKDHKKAKNLFELSHTIGFDLSDVDKHHPLTISAMGLIRRTISNYGGDKDGTKWGDYKAPLFVDAVSALLACWKDTDVGEIPGNLVEGFTAFLHTADNVIPRGQPLRHDRLRLFLDEVVDHYLDGDKNKIKELMAKLGVTSSNQYAVEGCVCFMKAWNKVNSNKNKGNKPAGFYKYVKFTESQIRSRSRVEKGEKLEKMAHQEDLCK